MKRKLNDCEPGMRGEAWAYDDWSEFVAEFPVAASGRARAMSVVTAMDVVNANGDTWQAPRFHRYVGTA